MKKRIISAIVALLIVVPLIYLGGVYFAVLAGLLSVLAYKEMLDLKENSIEIPMVIKCVGLIDLLTFVYATYCGYSVFDGLSYRLLGIYLITLLIPTLFYKHGDYTTKEAFYLLGVVFLLGSVFNSFIAVRLESIHLLVYLILICSLTDAFAMFTGMLIGKHKITPNISPKKTLEGCIGGFIVGSTVSIIYYSCLIGKCNYKIILMTGVLSIIGQLGDLFFSKVKRENKIKDFSNIMPGHGGILDRLDSLCFVVLAYLVIISFI